ncbi:MAG: response regulator [Holophaga sp.]|nr:response regulator [Holophaga sp.]
MSIPVKRDEGADLGSPWDTNDPPDTQHLKPTLLFIDDDAYMRRLMTQRLVHLGAEVESVAGSQDALLYLEGHRPDLIISDAVMPGMDGFDLCRQIKANPLLQSIPFIILTALRGDLRQRSIQAGADDFLSKLEDPVVFRLRSRLAFQLGIRLAAVAEEPAPTQEASLLVISGSRVIHAQLETHLQKEGIQVRGAATLAEALPLLQAGPPDVMALDLAFGQEALLPWITQVRALPGCATFPILVLAAKAEEPALEALEPLIQDRLPKPLDGQESRHRVHLLLRIARI